MTRIVNFLAVVAVTTAASANANCDASGCSSCVVTGAASVCVNYTAPPPPPTCGGCANICSLTACTANCGASCNICVRGLLAPSCVQVTAGTGYLLQAQSSLDAGLDLSLFGSSPTLTNVDASTSGTVSGNAIVTLSGSSAIANLNVGGGFATNAIFAVNSSITVTAWNNNAGTTKVDNNCGTLVVGNLSVGGSSFSVFQGCSTASTTSVTINNIDFSARGAFTGSSTLHISGGSAKVGGSASGSASASITGTGNLQLSGGVSIDGNVPQSVTIKVAAAGSSAPLVAIDAGSKLNISGNVQGSGGAIVVNGQFVLGSTTATVDPKVVVNAGASLVIESATALQAKAVDVSAQATLVLSASANKGAVYVDKMAKCLGTVQIKLATTASAFVSSSAAGAGVGFTYSSNNVPADLAKCSVEVVDSTGAKFQLTSTTSASAGRRLLASEGTATWGSNSMTYKMGQQSSDATSFVLLPVVLIGAVGLWA